MLHARGMGGGAVTSGACQDLFASADVTRLIDLALAEDLGDAGDVTTLALVPPTARTSARIIAREELVVCGGGLAEAVFRRFDAGVAFEALVPDGGRVPAGGDVARITGLAAGILTAERTVLNFMQRLCGIATLTARFVALAAPHGTRILDTRKTTPGMRRLEKYAVTCGGGVNHRFGLYDRVLIKDNHRRFWVQDGRPTLDAAVRAARTAYPGLAVEVEVETEAELLNVLEARPEWILLDNMSPERLRRCVALCAGRSQLEASGGIRLENVAAVASTGVDAISLGCLTHSAPSVDLSLEFE